jgi:hypothetical protein
LDNGSGSSGLIVGGTSGATLGGITPQDYNTGGKSLYVLLQGIK